MKSATLRNLPRQPLIFAVVGFFLGLGNPLGTLFFLAVFNNEGFRAGLRLALANHPQVFIAESFTGCLVLSLTGFFIGRLLKKTEKQRDVFEDTASRDSLTGLLNHRSILQKLTELAHDPRETSRPFCVVMVDIDFFKEVNDTQGHLVGDEVLAWLSQALIEGTRDSDFVGRYGGEEFLLVLTQTDQKGAKVVLDRLLTRIRQHRFGVTHHKGQSFSITVTMGVSRSSELVEGNALALVERADERLLQGKREGRNRIIFPSVTSTSKS